MNRPCPNDGREMTKESYTRMKWLEHVPPEVQAAHAVGKSLPDHPWVKEHTFNRWTCRPCKLTIDEGME